MGTGGPSQVSGSFTVTSATVTLRPISFVATEPITLTIPPGSYRFTGYVRRYRGESIPVLEANKVPFTSGSLSGTLTIYIACTYSMAYTYAYDLTPIGFFVDNVRFSNGAGGQGGDGKMVLDGISNSLDITAASIYRFKTEIPYLK